MFETFEKRSYESANGGRILKGKKNFGGSGLADVKVNSGAYLKATTTQTKYTVTSPSTSTSLINATLEVSLENKGHSRSNKTQYKVVLPEGVQFISAQNARANYNSSNRLLTLNVDRIEPEQKHYVYSFLPEPIKKILMLHSVYVTDGINMNRRNGSRDFGSNVMIIISDMAVITNMLKLNLIKEEEMLLSQHNLLRWKCIKLICNKNIIK